MLTAVIPVAIVPAFLILGLGIVARAVAAQHVTGRIAQYAPERGSTVLRDALLANADRRAASAALIDLAVKRKVRLLAGGRSKREPIGVELVSGATLSPEEIDLLDALFGPEHTHGRVRRFSADRRALAGRLRSVVSDTEHALARDGLIAERRTTWPGMTLTVLAYLGMLVEALLIVMALVNADVPALSATILAVAATIATIIVTPPSWRRFLPAARPRREHLDGLRQYLTSAEADRLRVLQSPSGADLHESDVAADGSGPEFASGPLARFHLHERLLPYAVLFGLEREWMARLELEHDALERSNLDTLADAIDVTAEVARALEAAGGAVELVAAVGDLVDAGGTVLEGVGNLFEALNA
ncbi:DUF2207 domain-containing protein [Agromyces sp. H66]|uniref:DUF2207 family protein n=1 Tax=Agromyces sp. H66 TaxID=2529859 RepID=UPI0010A9C919|nr:DUF2207 domain-containing protein [Agromyces sp. H66]